MYIEQQEVSEVPPDDARGRPNTRSQLIEHYEAIARASQSMLEAARASNWDQVGRLEEQCRTLIDALNEASSAAPLAPIENRRRMELLQRILADDAEIRDHSDPWLKQLEHLLTSKLPRR